MPLKASNFATATDAQIIMAYLALSALTSASIDKPPADLAAFQLDVLRPLLLTELYKRGLAIILTINVMP